jgi:hypothetical protein
MDYGIKILKMELKLQKEYLSNVMNSFTDCEVPIRIKQIRNETKKNIRELKKAIIVSKLDLKEIENVVQLLHAADWEYGNSKKRCAELVEKTRNEIGYTKEDFRVCLKHRCN